MAIDGVPSPHEPRNRAERRAAARRSRRTGIAVAGGASVLAGGLSVVGMASASGAEVTTIVVDSGADVQDLGDGVTTLREAVGTANTDMQATTITFAEDLDEIVMSAGQLRIDEAVTIEGPGSGALTIRAEDDADANAGDRLFYLRGADDVTISGVTITGFELGAGNSNDPDNYYGGAIRSNDTNLTVDDVTLSYNTSAGGTGGALHFGQSYPYVLGPDLTVTGSTLRHNGADSGGGLSVWGGDQVTITGSTIEANTASAGSGGGLDLGILDDGAVTISEDTELTGNTATAGGGGVAIQAGYDATIAISDTVVTGNEAGGDFGRGGGGIRISTERYASVSITDVEISGNVLGASEGGGLDLYVAAYSDIDIAGTTISDNEAYGTGGGASIGMEDRSTLTITDSVVSGNDSTDSHGGGLAVDADSYTTVEIDGIEITGNTALNDAGGAGFSGDGSVAITDSTITGNTSGDNGGGIALDVYGYGSIEISGSVIDDNSAGYGGGVMVDLGDYATLDITETSISGNDASASEESEVGGGLGLDIRGAASATLTESTIDGNQATAGEGGGIAAAINTDAEVGLRIERSTISDNAAYYSGGGILLDSESTVVISGSTISGNTTEVDGGGVVAGDRGVLDIEHSTITGNTAAGHGGGILSSSLSSGGSGYAADVSLDHTIVAGNSSPEDGEDDLALLDEVVPSGTPVVTPASIAAMWSLIGDAGATGITDGVDGNVVGEDPLLGDLADNGGPTLTHLPGASSPVRDAGDPDMEGAPDTDQRGEDRVVDDVIDIGSVELGVQATTTTTVAPTIVGSTPPTTTPPPTTPPPTTAPTNQPPPPPPPARGGGGQPVFVSPQGEVVRVPLPPNAPPQRVTASVALSPTESVAVSDSGQVFFTNPEHDHGGIPEDLPLQAPIVGLGVHWTQEGSSTAAFGAAAAGDWVPSGYWLLGADGGVFSFGTARFFGSTGAMRLNQPVVAITPTATGQGYYLLAGDGGVFTFGDATFFGSTGATKLNQPVVSMTPTPTGKGYYLVAADGGVFTFGDAVFRGSGAATGRTFTGAVLTESGDGYWLLEADGTRLPFGAAS